VEDSQSVAVEAAIAQVPLQASSVPTSGPAPAAVSAPPPAPAPIAASAPVPVAATVAPRVPATPVVSSGLTAPTAIAPDAAAVPDTFSSKQLLTKKRREVLVPVTFRMNQSLKELLEKVAKDREINQTDLINEGIELNLKRYLQS